MLVSKGELDWASLISGGGGVGDLVVVDVVVDNVVDGHLVVFNVDLATGILVVIIRRIDPVV